MSEPVGVLLTALDSVFDELTHACATYSPSLVPEEIGIITSLSTGIATISGQLQRRSPGFGVQRG